MPCIRPCSINSSIIRSLLCAFVSSFLFQDFVMVLYSSVSLSSVARMVTGTYETEFASMKKGQART